MVKIKKDIKIIAKNKKAFFDYEILDTLEAGIVLSGAEVKSIRAGKVNLKGSFISFMQDKAGDPFVMGMHVSPYFFADNRDYNETAKRRLLLKRSEIQRLQKTMNEAGISLVPTKIYFRRGLVKLQIALVRGKKKHDKRHDLKKKSQNRDIERNLKKFS